MCLEDADKNSGLSPAMPRPLCKSSKTATEVGLLNEHHLAVQHRVARAFRLALKPLRRLVHHVRTSCSSSPEELSAFSDA